MTSPNCAPTWNTSNRKPRIPIFGKIPKRRLGTVQEAANCVLFLLSPASEYVTGSTLVVDGGLVAVSPPFQSELPGA